MAGGNADLEAEIRDRAYQLWEQEGRPEGREEEFWLRAQAEVISSPASVAEQAVNGLAGETERASLSLEGTSRH